MLVSCFISKLLTECLQNTYLNLRDTKCVRLEDIKVKVHPITCREGIGAE